MLGTLRDINYSMFITEKENWEMLLIVTWR